MEETKHNQNGGKNDDCPLCKVSEETIKRLKTEQKEETQKEKKSAEEPKKKSPFNLTVWLPVFIFLGGIITFYQLNSGQSGKADETGNSAKNAGILETLPKAPGVGKAAPLFTTRDINGNEISLDEFLAKKPVL